MSSHYCLEYVRTHDRSRFWCTLFAHREERDALCAVYAFNIDIARIAETVSEPMLGLVRMEWWREALREIYAGVPPRKHEIVEALAEAIQRYSLPFSLFEELMHAREHDLDTGPFANEEAFDAYARITGGNVSELALSTFGIKDEEALRAARHSGTAWAMVGVLRAMRFLALQQRCYVPESLLHSKQLTVEDFFAGRPRDAYPPLFETLAARARTHLEEAMRYQSAIPKHARTVTLLNPLTHAYLKRMKACDYALFTHDIEQPRLPLFLRLALQGFFL